MSITKIAELSATGYCFIRSKKSAAEVAKRTGATIRITNISNANYMLLMPALIDKDEKYPDDCIIEQIIVEKSKENGKVLSNAERKKRYRTKNNVLFQRSIEITEQMAELEQKAFAMAETRFDSMAEVRKAAYMHGLLFLANVGSGEKLKRGRDYETLGI